MSKRFSPAKTKKEVLQVEGSDEAPYQCQGHDSCPPVTWRSRRVDMRSMLGIPWVTEASIWGEMQT